jgi:DNA-binding response OmpR family regulator
MGCGVDSMQEPRRILVVDDVAENREVLTRRLLRRGYVVVEAEDGLPALALIEQQSFDLVLLDWMMPGMDGEKVLQHIRAKHTPLSLPVIMVTARTETGDVVRALEQGANDFISKPVNFQIAMARIDKQIAHKRAEEALAQMYLELERRVDERTAELQDQLLKAQSAVMRIADLLATNPPKEVVGQIEAALGLSADAANSFRSIG